MLYYNHRKGKAQTATTLDQHSVRGCGFKSRSGRQRPLRLIGEDAGKNRKLCFVYGLAAQMEERRIVSPEVAGSSPVQVAKCLLRLGGQDIRFPSGGRGFKSRRGLHRKRFATFSPGNRKQAVVEYRQQRKTEQT